MQLASWAPRRARAANVRTGAQRSRSAGCSGPCALNHHTRCSTMMSTFIMALSIAVTTSCTVDTARPHYQHPPRPRSALVQAVVVAATATAATAVASAVAAATSTSTTGGAAAEATMHSVADADGREWLQRLSFAARREGRARMQAVPGGLSNRNFKVWWEVSSLVQRACACDNCVASLVRSHCIILATHERLHRALASAVARVPITPKLHSHAH
jgi:hypothetical protein